MLAALETQLETELGRTDLNTVTGTAMSKPGSDVKIKVSVDGMPSDDYAITVKSPDQLNPQDISHTANGTFGYQSEITYTIRDQFGALLGVGNMKINEKFIGPKQVDFPNSDWQMTDPQSKTLSNPILSDVIRETHLKRHPRRKRRRMGPPKWSIGDRKYISAATK